MWNQLLAQCVIILRTTAFFGQETKRGIIVGSALVSCLAGVASYRIYVAATQTEGMRTLQGFYDLL